MNLADRLKAVRDKAQHNGLPMRRTDASLYDLLAEIKAICEDVTRDGAVDELRQIYWQQGLRSNKRKRYVETGADVHILACRYVLDTQDSRNSTYRYALALREADKRQINAASLTEWLTDNGGVNALYKARVTEFKRRMVKTLNLTSAVEVAGSEAFSLTLRRLPNGFFEVVI
jgi:hypothetical protein